MPHVAESHPKSVLLLGAGELGAEVAKAARKRDDLKVIAFARYAGAPATKFAHTTEVFDVSNHDTLLHHLTQHQPDVVLPEIEAISLTALRAWSAQKPHDPVVPSLHATEITMNRWRLHTLTKELGIPTAERHFVSSYEELATTFSQMKGEYAVLKPLQSSSGKGQVVLSKTTLMEDAWSYMTAHQRGGHDKEGGALIESHVPILQEWTLLAFRHAGGIVWLGPIYHRQHQGDWVESWLEPRPRWPRLLEQAKSIATSLCQSLGGFGLFALEFFIIQNQTLLLNEVATRPHDTGFVTLALGPSTQFELWLDLVCDTLPKEAPSCELEAAAYALRSPSHLHHPSLLVDSSSETHAIDFQKPLAHPGRRLGLVWSLGPGARSRVKLAALRSLATQNFGL